jgi:hypothetical protein
MKTETTCPVTTCQWHKGTGYNKPIPVMPFHVCMPNDLSKLRDEAAMKQCNSHTVAADCVAPDCSFIETSMIAKMSDEKAEMCRPKAVYTDLKSAIASGAITEANAASMIPTLDQVKMCVSLDNKDGCNNVPECQWGVMRGDDVPNTDPSKDVPLFTKEFCHPREIDVGKAEREFGECLATNTKDTCGVTNSCVWGNGIALIPKEDFCAPEMLTKAASSKRVLLLVPLHANGEWEPMLPIQ